jgi:hypothetical protein
MNPVPAHNADPKLHRLFTIDTKLSSQEINSLLGISVRVELDRKISVAQHEESRYKKIVQISVVTLMLTAFALLGSMYQLKIGPFYESSIVATTGK